MHWLFSKIVNYSRNCTENEPERGSQTSVNTKLSPGHHEPPLPVNIQQYNTYDINKKQGKTKTWEILQ